MNGRINLQREMNAHTKTEFFVIWISENSMKFSNTLFALAINFIGNDFLIHAWFGVCDEEKLGIVGSRY